jgi:hypothetical protein
MAMNNHAFTFKCGKLVDRLHPLAHGHQHSSLDPSGFPLGLFTTIDERNLATL